MRPIKWMAMTLALCLLLAALSVAPAEEQETAADGLGADISATIIDVDVRADAAEPEIAPAEYAGEDTGLSVESDGQEADAPAPEQPRAESPEGDGAIAGEYAVDAPALGLSYARVLTDQAPVAAAASSPEAVALLAAGETVLVTGASAGSLSVAFNADGVIAEGYMDAADIALMDAIETDAYLDQLAATEAVALYAGDIGWPLGALSVDSYAGPFSVMASSNYTQYSNDTVYTINGKDIYANMVPTKGAGNCWAWAQEIYQILWGCRFSSDFKGTAATGFNMLRNLSDAERLLTVDHLKAFIQSANLGATIRVGSCTSDCPKWDSDGLSCGHKGHSLILVGKSADGLTIMDDHSNSQHTRFYTWQGFCNAWKNYTYVKYIKWPNAPAIAPSETVDGYVVTGWEEAYRVRSTAASGVGVYSAPTGGALLEKLTFPGTFSAAKKSIDTFDGAYWMYGTSAAGTAGWLALSDSVVNARDIVAVTGISLDQTALALDAGSTAKLTAAVLPANATDPGVTWSSSDTAVVSVSDGALAALSAGTARITATSVDGSKTATCTVTVAYPTLQKALGRTGGNGTAKLCVGQQLQLTPDFATSKGWTVKGVKSSKAKCASVSSTGLVTANAAGKATITVTTKNKKKATLKIQVVDPTRPTKVRLQQGKTLKMKVGDTVQLNAVLSPVTARTTFKWKSSRKKVAAVDANGNVVARKKGTATIAVKTANGKVAKIKIKVS